MIKDLIEVTMSKSILIQGDSSSLLDYGLCTTK